jgi:hypothetical protein
MDSALDNLSFPPQQGSKFFDIAIDFPKTFISKARNHARRGGVSIGKVYHIQAETQPGRTSLLAGVH